MKVENFNEVKARIAEMQEYQKKLNILSQPVIITITQYPIDGSGEIVFKHSKTQVNEQDVAEEFTKYLAEFYRKRIKEIEIEIEAL